MTVLKSTETRHSTMPIEVGSNGREPIAAISISVPKDSAIAPTEALKLALLWIRRVLGLLARYQAHQAVSSTKVMYNSDAVRLFFLNAATAVTTAAMAVKPSKPVTHELWITRADDGLGGVK